MAQFLGTALETVYQTLRLQNEPPLTRFIVEQLTTSHWFNIDAARNGWNSKHVSYKDAAAGCLGGVAAGFAGVYLAPGRIVWTRKF